MSYEAGTLFLPVIPSFDNFQRRVKQWAENNPALRQMGNDAGAEYGVGVAEGIDKNRGKARKASEALGKEVGDGLSKSLAQSDKWASGLETRLKAAQRSLGDTQKAVRQQLREIEKDFSRGAMTAAQAEARIKKVSQSLAIRAAAAKSPRGRANSRSALDSLTGDATLSREYIENEKKKTRAADREARKRSAIVADELKAAEKELAKAEKAYDRMQNAQTKRALEEAKKRERAAEHESRVAQKEADRAAKRADALERERTAAARREAKARTAIETAAAKEQIRTQGHATRQRESLLARNAAASHRARLAEQRAQGNNSAARGLNRVTGFLTGNRDAQDGANAFRAFNAMILLAATLGTALTPIIATLGAGIAAMIPILLGAGAGLGVFALGLSGIKGAVEALGKQQDATSKSSKAYQNQVDTTGKAARRAAQAVVSAERGVADAQRGVANARRDAARQIENAIENQRTAERNLIQAQRDAIRAQQDLVEARRKAVRDLRDLDNAVAQNRLDERSGVIDVFNARMRRDAVARDPGATNLEREEASIALEQAELNLKRTREEQKDLAGEKKKADKEGVNGTEGVLAAQENLIEAIRAEKEARRDVGRAARDVDEARRDGAERVRDAIERVRDAEINLANAREDAADANRASNEAIAGGATAIDEVAEAMDKLSPAGQRFARFIFGLRGSFDALRKSAQEGLLPGLQSALQQLLSFYGAGFSGWVATMAQDLGDLMRVMGTRFTSGGFPEFFSEFAQASRQFTADALIGTVNFLEAFANIFVVARPFLHMFSGWLLGVSETFRNWTASERGQNALTRFFEGLADIGPKVTDFFNRAAPGLAKIAVALASIGLVILEALGSLFEKIGNLDQKVVTTIVAALIALLVAFQLATGFVALTSALAVIVGAPWLALAAGIAAVVGAMFLLSDQKDLEKLGKVLAPVITIFKDLWKMISENLMEVWNDVLLPGIKELGQVISKELMPSLSRFWDLIKPFVGWVVDFLGDMLKGALKGAFQAIGGLITFIGGLMDLIVGVFTGDWDMVKKGLGKIFRGLKDFVVGALKVIFYVGPLKLIKVAFRLLNAVFGRFFTKTIPGTIRKAWKFIREAVARILERITSLFRAGTRKIGNLFGDVAKKIRGLLPENVRRALKAAFEKLSGFIMAPIKWAVDVVFNKGIFAAIRKIKGALGIGDKKTPANIVFPKGGGSSGANSGGGRQQKYRGGIMGITDNGGVLPGYTPGRDVIDARLSGGEAIMRPEFTSAVGPRWVDAMNKLARSGAGRLRNALFGGGPRRYAKGGVVWPTTTKALSGDYRGHTGVDIRAGMGSPVFAAQSGRVTQANMWNYSYGHHLRILGKDGVETIYAHLSKLMARVGQTVKAGKQIGLSGSTGNSQGPHLHFEVRPGMTRGAALAYLGNGTIPAGGKGGSADPLAGLKSLWSKYNPMAMGRKMFAGIQNKMKGTGTFGRELAGAPMKLLKTIAQWAKAKVGLGGKTPSKLYDAGGWIKPGYTAVHNASGKPEPVFSASQWQVLKGNLERGMAAPGGTREYHWHDASSTPEQFASAVIRAERREARKSSSRLPSSV